VTSPPYWGLRDYGHAGQIGHEETPQQFISALVEVFREVRRAMKDDGTLWINLGDSYARRAGVEKPQSCNKNDSLGKYKVAINKIPDGLKPKDLVGIPWRVALALQADGWYLRQDIIWHKPNPMPESVTDRCAKAHEYIFLLAKSEHYYFDNEAIRTATSSRKSVWEQAVSTFDGAHFATYPTDLIKPCIMAGTKHGDTVLDPFGGSGTTGAVALELGRRAILIEINGDYLPIIDSRTHTTYGLAL
jgi:site-specific DNA-methyltransferase (adenine-specific)